MSLYTYASMVYILQILILIALRALWSENAIFDQPTTRSKFGRSAVNGEGMDSFMLTCMYAALCMLTCMQEVKAAEQDF